MGREDHPGAQKTSTLGFMQNSPFFNPFPTFARYILIYDLNWEQVRKFPAQLCHLVQQKRLLIIYVVKYELATLPFK